MLNELMDNIERHNENPLECMALHLTIMMAGFIKRIHLFEFKLTHAITLFTAYSLVTPML